MKKLYSTLVALSVMAATPSISVVAQAENGHDGTTNAPSFTLNASSTMQKAAEEETSYELITEQPAGTTKLFSMSCLQMRISNKQLQSKEVDGIVSYITFGDNDSVYIKDIISTDYTKTWVKGSLKDDTIRIATPQYVYHYAMGSYSLDYYIYKMKYDIANDTIVKCDDNEMLFTYDGTTITAIDQTEFLGLCLADGTWVGYGDMKQSYTLVADQKTTLPAEAEAEQYQLTYKDETGLDCSRLVQAAIVADSFYVQGLDDQYVPTSWMRGHIDGDKVVFDKQLVDDNYLTRYLLYLTAAEEDASSEDASYVLKDALTFSYDSEKKSLSTDETLVLNRGSKNYDPILTYYAPQFTPFADVAAVPEAPVIVEFTKYGDPDMWGFSGNYGTMTFTFPTIGTNGEGLDTEKLYIQIMADSVPMALSLDDYSDLWLYYDDDPTEIPYSYSDDIDFLTLSSGNHMVVFYFTGFEQIGLQSVYYGGGERNVSAVNYVDPDGNLITTGISSAANNTNTNPYKRYFDLSGRSISQPEAGHVYIEKVSDGNGVSTYRKVIK